MAELIMINEITTEQDVITALATCSGFPQSPQRTASTDTLLDLLLIWAGVE